MTSTIPILGFSAYSGTGKTTLLRQIIPALKQRGLRVSVIKHAHHDFDLDFPGKDSYELRKSGADQTVISTMTRMATITEFASPAVDPDLQQFIASLDSSRADIVLVEGY
jgi:molybdopterin-guanine dinucleotide biosynthesis protein MobB